MEAAVVSASHGAMASLLGKLGELLTAKYKLLQEAKGQIMFLKAELESMHAFLKKISDAEEPDEQDKCWAKEVRELSYDIEDSVSEFMLRVQRDSSKPRGFKGFINRSIKLLTTMNIRHEIAKEFEGLQIRVKEASERRLRYRIDDTVPKENNTAIDPRLLMLHAETMSLVGIEGPRDQLIQLMSEEGVPTYQLKVLSIVGFGGLGKTTLANEIYRKLEGKFHCRAFVSVSQKPNMRKIMRSILYGVGFAAPKDSNMEMWEEPELISALRKFLLGRRYFIVIDDIWDASAWEIIRCAFPENMDGSRIMTTTRIETVARACCSNNIEFVYKMRPLSDQDSRILFFKRIFGSEDACPLYLKAVSAQILKKCGGLPLAVITMSSLLANQPNKLKEQWEYVLKSLGSNFEVSPSLIRMRQILNLSYITLPHYLKTCMLYLGIYPEDYTIDKNDLTRQWVAEGFITKTHGLDPEDVATSYFNELINRSMIQPSYVGDNGQVMSCRVHDMMLDLILLKSKEENFVTVLDSIQGMEGQREKIRRLSLHLDGPIDERVGGSVLLSQVRMLARFGTSAYLPCFLLFKHLRVLTIDISQSSSLLDLTGICHLFLLRYIEITGFSSHTIKLPKKIGSLHQLETFHIEIFPYELPTDIAHMNWLLHLISPHSLMVADGIGSMKSLRTLRCCFNLITISPHHIKALGELTNLTNLEIEFVAAENSDSKVEVDRCKEVVCTCLEKLCNLKYLDIGSGTMRNVFCLDDVSCVVSPSFCHLQISRPPLAAWFSRVPVWIGQQPNFYDLSLVVKEMLEDDIGILAQLPSLIRLELWIKGAPKDKIIIRGGGGLFPVLKHFEIGCSRISCLTFEAGAMAKLERLQLCFNAQGWDRYGAAAPAGIEHLSRLKEISVNIGSQFAKESNKRAALSVLRDVADMHPGRPITNIKLSSGRYTFDGMDDEPHETTEHEGDGGSSTGRYIGFPPATSSAVLYSTPGLGRNALYLGRVRFSRPHWAWDKTKSRGPFNK